jgi:hypothetical protein
MRPGPWLTVALVAGVGLAMGSCAKLSPSGFWLEYRPDLIVAKGADQGPWGGVRWIHWISRPPGAFGSEETAHFAASHGWTCEKPVAYTAERMRHWRYSGQEVFPLFFSGPEEKPIDHMTEKFPRHITDDSIIMTCDTQWTRVKPGDTDATSAHGYIQINVGGTRMAVYHLWGEI